ncbi:hypothetical protein, partial [Staphylococcus epidermidis]|uniref:hypothetical protein n=1 Tax=Staphylococcus epidermidis TaxID=1282 RepID=UPI0011A9FB37
TININLTHKQYHKVKHFAQLPNINPTTYPTLLPLPNPIKPALIHKTYTSSHVVQQLNQHNQELKTDIQTLQTHNNHLKTKITYSKQPHPTTI